MRSSSSPSRSPVTVLVPQARLARGGHAATPMPLRRPRGIILAARRISQRQHGSSGAPTCTPSGAPPYTPAAPAVFLGCDHPSCTPSGAPHLVARDCPWTCPRRVIGRRLLRHRPAPSPRSAARPPTRRAQRRRSCARAVSTAQHARMYARMYAQHARIYARRGLTRLIATDSIKSSVIATDRHLKCKGPACIRPSDCYLRRGCLALLICDDSYYVALAEIMLHVHRLLHGTRTSSHFKQLG